MLYYSLVIALCLGVAAAKPGNVRDDSLNHYMDMVMDNLEVLLVENGLDPVALPNNSMGFNNTVLGVVWHGEAKLYDGWLRGLASIHRSNDAEFIKNSQGQVMGLTAELSIGDMQGHYVCLAKFMDLGPVADVFITVEAGSSVYFESILDTQECKFKVDTLEVTNMGSIDVSIKGLSVLGWIVSGLMNFVMIFINGFIREIVEDVVKGLTDDALDAVDLTPIGSIIGCIPPQNLI